MPVILGIIMFFTYVIIFKMEVICYFFWNWNWNFGILVEVISPASKSQCCSLVFINYRQMNEAVNL